MQGRIPGPMGRRQRGATSPPPSVAARQRGVALIEVLVSVLLFSFGLLGLIGLEARSINLSVDSEDRNRAAVFANEIASWMWTNGTVTVPAAQLALWQGQISTPTAAGLSNGTVAVTTTAGTTNSADILITWNPPSDGASVANTTLSTRVILPP